MSMIKVPEFTYYPVGDVKRENPFHWNGGRVGNDFEHLGSNARMMDMCAESGYLADMVGFYNIGLGVALNWPETRTLPEQARKAGSHVYHLFHESLTTTGASPVTNDACRTAECLDPSEGYTSVTWIKRPAGFQRLDLDTWKAFTDEKSILIPAYFPEEGYVLMTDLGTHCMSTGIPFEAGSYSEAFKSWKDADFDISAAYMRAIGIEAQNYAYAGDPDSGDWAVGRWGVQKNTGPLCIGAEFDPDDSGPSICTFRIDRNAA